MPLFYSGQANYIQAMNAASDEAFATTVAATVGGTTTLDLSTGGSYFLNMGAGNTTLALTAPPTTAYKFTLYVKQNDGTLRSMTAWPSGTTWPAATAPTFTTGSGKVDIVEFRTINSGATWYARVVAQNY